jgi:hypothetical protein
MAKMLASCTACTLLRDVEDPTSSSQSAHRWRQGSQPYASVALCSQKEFLVVIIVSGWVLSRVIVRISGPGSFTHWNGSPLQPLDNNVWVSGPVWSIWRNEASWPYRDSNSAPSTVISRRIEDTFNIATIQRRMVRWQKNGNDLVTKYFTSICLVWTYWTLCKISSQRASVASYF